MDDSELPGPSTHVHTGKHTASKRIQARIRPAMTSRGIQCKPCMRDVGVQCNLMPTSSTPNVSDDDTSDISDISSGDSNRGQNMEESRLEESIVDTGKDDSMQMDTTEEDLNDIILDGREHLGTYKELKFIVYQSSLLELFQICPKCDSLSDAKFHQNGTCVSVAQKCTACTYQRKWQSQPLLGNTPSGNLLLQRSILKSGIL